MSSSEDLNPLSKEHVDDAPLEGVLTAEEIHQLERSGMTLEDVIKTIESRA
jgi:hypothetical protein